MNLTKYEKETIILFNEAEKTANVYTYNQKMLRRLDSLAQTRPDDCKQLKKYPDEKLAEYSIPKSWIKINPPHVVAPLSEEEKQKRRERLAALRAR